MGGTAATAAQLDLDDTVGTAHTPLGCRTGILQYGDALDVLGVDVQQGGELLLVVHVGEVDGLSVLGQFEDVVVHDNQGLGTTVDGGGTAQAHGGTGTQVTGVGHDVQTGNLSLQGLVDRFEGQTLEVVHLHRRYGTRILTCRNVEARGGRLLLT